MGFKAAFFDRDNTLTCADPKITSTVRGLICDWSNVPYPPTGQEQTLAFRLAEYPEYGCKTIEEEKAFFRRMYVELLKLRGISERVDERADMLLEMSYCKDRAPHPDAVKTLEYFKGCGYRLGVISDTSLSLRQTLEGAGIAHYFDCFIYSDLVGVMKPDPLIYNTALGSLGVKAEESLYVDDYDVEADGARALGFTSFHIDRTGGDDTEWGITSLWDMVEYVRSHP